MPDSHRVIDEHTLAAFIAGTLPKSRREEVITFLAGNSDACELLQMAYDALEAAHDANLRRVVQSTEPGIRAGTHSRHSGRAAAKSSPHPGAGRHVAAAAIVFTIGMVLRIAFGPPTDAMPSSFPIDSENLQVEIRLAEGPTITWSALDNAYAYRIVVSDLASAGNVGRYETRKSEIRRGHPVVTDLRTKLQQGQTYTLRIDAVDARNRLIRSSDTIEFEVP